jgi:hypothetical protein
VNTCVPPVGRVAVAGNTLTEILSCSVTAAELLACGSAALTAVMVALGGEGNIAGAAYIPVAEIVPLPGPPLGTPFTCHVTFVFDVPVTVAVNCCVWPNESAMLGGETVTTTDGGGGGAESIRSTCFRNWPTKFEIRSKEFLTGCSRALATTKNCSQLDLLVQEIVRDKMCVVSPCTLAMHAVCHQGAALRSIAMQR